MDGVVFKCNQEIEAADAWFVIDGLSAVEESCVVPESQTFFVSGENLSPPNYLLFSDMQLFLHQFSHVHSVFPTLKTNGRFSQPFLPWMVNAGRGEVFVPHARDLNFLANFEFPRKTRAISVFCSTKSTVPEHSVRLAFVRRLKSYFGDDLDWFGSGQNPIDEKWDGLHQYALTIALENRVSPGMFTEKILDPFLAWTYPVYWGAPDIGSFLPVGKGQVLDLRNFDDSIRTIRLALDIATKQESIDNLHAGREAVMGDLHFLRRIIELARIQEDSAKPKRKLVTIRPRKFFSRQLFPELAIRRARNRIFGESTLL